MKGKTEQQVIYDVGLRKLTNLKQEKLKMNLEQVIFEYGKLQLNYVAISNQNQQLSQQLAAANKDKDQLREQIDGLSDQLRATQDGSLNKPETNLREMPAPVEN